MITRDRYHLCESHANQNFQRLFGKLGDNSVDQVKDASVIRDHVAASPLRRRVLLANGVALDSVTWRDDRRVLAAS